MPVATLNFEREIKNLRAEVAALKNEFVKMQSAFQDVQEQYAYAVMELTDLIKTLSGEIKNSVEKNKTELQDEQFQNILGLSKKIDNANKGLTENFSQSLLNILSENENQSAWQDEQKNLLTEKFTQLEKISDAQQINFRNHFDTIENSLAAQQKMFEEIFTRQNSATEKNFDSLQKNLTKFSSKIDETLSENQKALLKKINSIGNNREDIFKTLNAFEELLRLIAANLLISQVGTEVNPSDEIENIADNQKKLAKKIDKMENRQKDFYKVINSLTENLTSAKAAPTTSAHQKSSYELNAAEKKYRTGLNYFEGRNGYSINKTYAFKYFIEAANMGNVEAMSKVADCYRYGWGVVQDHHEADYWHKKYVFAL